MARNDEEVERFYQELEGLQLQMPGSGGETVSFSAKDVLLNMVRKQYPDWRNRGEKTSVPPARIPKLFLHNLHMEKSLEKTLKSTQKGDEAEKQLYKNFMGGDFSGQPGFIVFPNFDGSHLFKTQIARVEIDMILVHQMKGVFIFNVKKVGGKSAASNKMKEDIAKHRNFVQMLMHFNNAENEIPVHTVICNFNDATNRFKELSAKTTDIESNVFNETIVLNKDELCSTNFTKTWDRIFEKNENKSTSSFLKLDILVARLIALSSIESSLALIHEQMASGYLQSVGSRKHLETQISPCLRDQESVDTITALSKTKNQKGREKYISWTKDQMWVISKVYEHFMGPSERGLRLLVSGCKGSGKTMLLIFLAQLIQKILQSRGRSPYGDVLVCESSGSCPVLLEHLKQRFDSSNIAVFSYPSEFNKT